MDFYKPWTLELLPESKKKYILEYDLEQGRGYLGDPQKSTIIKVGLCPFCRTPMIEARGCQHVVFFYDVRSKEYIYIRDDFKKHLQSSSENNKKWVDPQDLAKNVIGLDICIALVGKFGINGSIWGYLPEK